MTENKKIGLTHLQKERLQYLSTKEKITDNQKEEIAKLEEKRDRKPELSQTTKTHCKDVLKGILYDRRREIWSKHMEKGNFVEEASISLYSEHTGKLFLKNEETFENEWLRGTPDNIQGIVIDIKSSWDLHTFPMFETELPNKDYFAQVQGYMALTGLDKAKIVYCLVDTPEHIIVGEIYSRCRRANIIDPPLELEEEIRKEMTFSDIPPEHRVKEFEVIRDDDFIKRIPEQVRLCREYMKDITATLPVAAEYNVI